MPEPIPLVALLLSIVGLTISILAYHRDRPKVRAWAEIIWHQRGPQPDSSVPMLRIRIVNLGRRPIALLELGLRGKTQLWSTSLKEPEFPDQQLSPGEIGTIFDRHSLAQNSVVRLPEGDILDLVFWPEDCPFFIFTHSGPIVEAERIYVEDCAGARYRVKNDTKSLRQLFDAWSP